MLPPLEDLVHHLLHGALALLAVAVVGLEGLALPLVDFEQLPVTTVTGPVDDVPLLLAATSAAFGLLSVSVTHLARLLDVTAKLLRGFEGFVVRRRMWTP